MSIRQLTIFEYDAVVPGDGRITFGAVPKSVFQWLTDLCLAVPEGTPQWLKLTQRNGRTAVQVANYVGVLRAPCGFQIEVLPKVGKAGDEERGEREAGARRLLVQMLKCMAGFSHIRTGDADLLATRMPLFEIFIQQFLRSVQSIVKRGLRSDYVTEEGNLPALRGKIKVSPHLRHNVFRPDRFFTEHDLFQVNRPENRLLRQALQGVLRTTASQENQRLARELSFVFDEIPCCTDVSQDIQGIRIDRGMGYYESALEWAKLILRGMSPLTGSGGSRAASLLFPMEKLFEAYVEKHLRRQLSPTYMLKSQACTHHLVEHIDQRWFRLKPDLLVQDHARRNLLVLDTKWKLLDSTKDNRREKYQLSQADFYQLFAYGRYYLEGGGDVVLVYPKHSNFDKPLSRFQFQQSDDLSLWVLPFCLDTKRIMLPAGEDIGAYFGAGTGIRPSS